MRKLFCCSHPEPKIVPAGSSNPAGLRKAYSADADLGGAESATSSTFSGQDFRENPIARSVKKIFPQIDVTKCLEFEPFREVICLSQIGDIPQQSYNKLDDEQRLFYNALRRLQDWDLEGAEHLISLRGRVQVNAQWKAIFSGFGKEIQDRKASLGTEAFSHLENYCVEIRQELQNETLRKSLDAIVEGNLEKPPPRGTQSEFLLVSALYHLRRGEFGIVEKISKSLPNTPPSLDIYFLLIAMQIEATLKGKKMGLADRLSQTSPIP